MIRIAIIGGGISGLTAAYELELARRNGAPIDWQLYEASDRLGGIVETTRHSTPEGDFILEGGPDGWVSEKPWARELAIDLGLEDELIYSNDATRRTYILMPEPGGTGKLQPIPDHMRLMVPEDLSALDASPLFSESAKAAYARELDRASELRAAAPDTDESVASFVLRHFGEEVLNTLAAPLLSGVFGGDVNKLSVRAVMPQFVAMEREYGSLIAALRARSAQRTQPPPPIFTSLRNGMGSLIEALAAKLPPERLHLKKSVHHSWWDDEEWAIDFFRADELTVKRRFGADSEAPFDHILVATPLDTARHLFGSWDPVSTTLLPSRSAVTSMLPTDASSAVLVTFCWPAKAARIFTIPSGFGFLVPRPQQQSVISTEARRSGENCSFPATEPQLLACTFVDQKFPHRAPAGARILRAFFGGRSAEAVATRSDEAVAAIALQEVSKILGPLPAPDPVLTTVRRWPRSLPQYEIGHLDRMAQLDALVARIGNLTLLGNSYRGVGLPDLIRDARTAARAILQREPRTSPRATGVN